MTIEGTAIEETLNSLLQKNIRFYFKNKMFKQGKLLLYKQSNYFLSVILQNSKKGKIKFEIPIPYSIENWSEDNTIYFDYRLSALSKKKETLLKDLKEVKRTKESRFYDSIMEIQVLPNEEVI